MGVYKRESAEREADEIGLKFAHSKDVIGDMSRAYHVDFSDINIHTDAAADSRVRAAGKDALAVGNDLFFGRGVFESQNPENRALVAHEFAHTMQQGVVGSEGMVSESVPMGAEQGGKILDFFKRLFNLEKPEDNLMFAKDPTKAGGKNIGKFWREGNSSASKQSHADERRQGTMEYLQERYAGTEYENLLTSSVLKNAGGDIYVTGLSAARLVSGLGGALGGDMTKEDIGALYDNLLSGGRAAQLVHQQNLSEEEKAELASYTSEQKAGRDQKFDAGMLQLKGIYMAQLRRLKEKYGTYITQLHPEDFIGRVGSEFFDEMGLLQDTEQMMQSAAKYFDFENNADDAEFKRLSDYYNDAFVMLNLYTGADTNLGGEEFRPNEMQLAFQEEAGYMRRAQGAEAGIGGPGLTAKQQNAYNKRVQKRFGKGNLIHRLIGRFKKN